MEKLITMLFLFLAPAISNLNSRVYGGVTSEGSLEDHVDRKLKLLNKPAVHSIESEDGDIIDCVHIHKQPALDHPALKDHKIQMKPSSGFPKENLSTKTKSSKPMVSQTWQKSGSCPEGTVPIRRVRREDLLRATSLEHFGRKPRHVITASNTTTEDKEFGISLFVNDNKPSPVSIVNRSASILYTHGTNYIGIKGNINLWNPHVDSPGDITTAQIWLKAGPEDNFESIEAGWAVNPKLYGDKRTRFFVHWTKDGYKKTGCFDHTCSGFVQTAPEMALGQAISPVSSGEGLYDTTLGIYMDPNSGNWWLHYGNNLVIGYWPVKSLMNYMNGGATLVQWGGEVYSPNVKKTPHTKTGMGSGDYAAYMWGRACFIGDIRIIDSSLSLKYPEWVSTWADENNCYTTYNYVVPDAEPIFYFGGPGQNPLCP
ncbi:hypothetical protein PTKIN_Ptkin03bG0041500 [Pterospermum kingtungense]